MKTSHLNQRSYIGNETSNGVSSHHRWQERAREHDSDNETPPNLKAQRISKNPVKENRSLKLYQGSCECPV